MSGFMHSPITRLSTCPASSTFPVLPSSSRAIITSPTAHATAATLSSSPTTTLTATTRRHHREAPSISRIITSSTAAPLSSSTSTSTASEQLPILRAKTVPTRVLSPAEAIDALYATQHSRQRACYGAFYNSELGGIITDPALMFIHIDDHMVHRGHSVFDTAIITNGYMYQLDQHLERFFSSAAKAGIPLPKDTSKDQMRRIILETAAASCKQQAYVRYFLSAGRGGFGLSSAECLGSSFYVMVYSLDHQEQEHPDDTWADTYVTRQELDKHGQEDYLKGWKVKTSPVPQKPPFFSRLKSTNYLPNALAVIDAEADGFHQGIFVDNANGCIISEGPNMNIAVVLKDGTFVTPPFKNALAGLTMRRILELMPQAVQQGITEVKSVEQRDITVEEAKQAAEVMLVGSSLPVMPVVQWDNAVIADGRPGVTSLLLRTLMIRDMQYKEGSDQHVEIPYGRRFGAL